MDYDCDLLLEDAEMDGLLAGTGIPGAGDDGPVYTSAEPDLQMEFDSDQHQLLLSDRKRQILSDVHR